MPQPSLAPRSTPKVVREAGAPRKAKVVMARAKETVTMRLDAYLLDWFRRNRGYQTCINAVLRAYMNAESARR
jgi:uncharacterized protein (DUF4415 family)